MREEGNSKKSKQLTVLDTAKSLKCMLELSPRFGKMEAILLERVVP